MPNRHRNLSNVAKNKKNATKDHSPLQTFAEYSNVMMKLCKKYLAMKSLQASEEYLLLEVEIHEKHKESVFRALCYFRLFF